MMTPNPAVRIIGTACHDALIELLIRKRKQAGLRQWELAERLGEYQSFIARIEKGQRRIDVCEFLKIAKALKFDPGREVNKLFRQVPPD
jgi:transcriptional regulator with XRE-family HTH domain